MYPTIIPRYRPAVHRNRFSEPRRRVYAVEVYTREPYEYYSRIRLPELFRSGLSAEQLAIYRPGWYEGGSIQVPYDRLVLAMGSDSYRPLIPNSGLSGVFTVREYGDAEAIRGYMQAGTRHAVVIGGGLLGLEAARQLHGPELESLTVLEAAPRLLPRQLDETAAALLQLSDGRELPAETVLFCVGVIPRIGLAREAGLAVRRGMIVDAGLRSSDPDIFVAGDLVEFEGVVWGIIPAALEHAPVVAANLLGSRQNVAFVNGRIGRETTAEEGRARLW